VDVVPPQPGADVERRVHEEIEALLSGRLPTVADVERLPHTTRVVTESMRLYPPAWLVGRRAVNEYSIDGYYVPPRSIIVMSQWIVHRDARHYADPERFDPDRWTPEFKTRLARFAYFPFGGGPRHCIGESFAWMELVLLIATIAGRSCRPSRLSALRMRPSRLSNSSPATADRATSTVARGMASSVRIGRWRVSLPASDAACRGPNKRCLQTRLRFTTMIVLPEGEDILDVICGDPTISGSSDRTEWSTIDAVRRPCCAHGRAVHAAA
jgi:hypothetical protein